MFVDMYIYVNIYSRKCRVYVGCMKCEIRECIRGYMYIHINTYLHIYTHLQTHLHINNIVRESTSGQHHPRTCCRVCTLMKCRVCTLMKHRVEECIRGYIFTDI